MSQPIRSIQALSSNVTTNTDYAVLGSRLRQNGIPEGEISNLLGLVERTIRDNQEAVRVASEEAATRSVNSLLTVFVELMGIAHRVAAMDILNELRARTVGFGQQRLHGDCVRVAENVLMRGPRYISAEHILLAARQQQG